MGYLIKPSYVLLLIVAMLSLPLTVRAQQPPPAPTIRIPTVDTSHFPDVAIQVYGENLPTDLADLAVEVTEDGAPVVLDEDTTQQGVAGTQTAIIFDAAGNVTKNGPTNEPIYIEVGKTLRKLTSLDVLSSDRDYLTAISFGPDQQPTILHDWSQDHQAVVDSVYQYKPIERIGNTSIDGILRFTLDRMADQTLPKGQVQSIVLFTDGIDVFPLQGLFEAVQLAQARNIHIHTVMIGKDDAGPRHKLEDLARQTGGKFISLNSVDALDSFWPIIAQGGTRRILTYRSQQAKSGKVTVTFTLPDGKKIAVDADRIPPPLAPASVTIMTPVVGTVIERRGPQFNTPTQQLTPRTMAVQAFVEFPDSRKIRSLEYQIVRWEAVTGDFSQPFELEISDLGAGKYTVRARVVDDLGIETLSEPVEFSIRTILPPAPTNTPDLTATANALEVITSATKSAIAQQTKVASDATATQVAAENTVIEIQNNRLSIATVAASVFGLAMLGFAIYVLSNRDRRKAATQVITGTVAAVTQPFMPARRRGARAGSEQPRAQLRLVEDGGVADAPQSIPLTRVGISIGRDPNVVNIVLSDKHISKLHCRIVEDANSAGYRLLDEGSTSGTLIDDHEVDIKGTVLKHGDIISIGPVQYQFEMAGQPARRAGRDNDPDTQSSIYDQDDNTEPYIQAPGKSKTEPYRPGKDK